MQVLVLADRRVPVQKATTPPPVSTSMDLADQGAVCSTLEARGRLLVSTMDIWTSL